MLAGLATLVLAAAATIPDDEFSPYASLFDWSPIAEVLEQQIAFVRIAADFFFLIDCC